MFPAAEEIWLTVDFAKSRDGHDVRRAASLGHQVLNFFRNRVAKRFNLCLINPLQFLLCVAEDGEGDHVNLFTYHVILVSGRGVHLPAFASKKPRHTEGMTELSGHFGRFRFQIVKESAWFFGKHEFNPGRFEIYPNGHIRKESDEPGYHRIAARRYLVKVGFDG